MRPGIIHEAKRYREDPKNLDALYEALCDSVVYFIDNGEGKPALVEVEGRGNIAAIFSSPSIAREFSEKLNLCRGKGESVVGNLGTDVDIVVDYGSEHGAIIKVPPKEQKVS